MFAVAAFQSNRLAAMRKSRIGQRTKRLGKFLRTDKRSFNKIPIFVARSSTRYNTWHFFWGGEYKSLYTHWVLNYGRRWLTPQCPHLSSQYYITDNNMLISWTDLSPIPVRSAVKSYLTTWCIQNLSRHALNRHTVSTSTVLGRLFQILTIRAEKEYLRKS